MSVRVELFVADVDASIRFYEAALGFRVERREPDYARLRRGEAVLGLAPTAKLPPRGHGRGFSQESVRAARGAGVEIVLEVDDLDAELDRAEASGYAFAETSSAARGVSATSASPTPTATTFA